VTFYLSSPNNQMTADKCRDMPVLLSYALFKGTRWLDDYVPTFERLLIDSGAYSEFNSGKAIDGAQYKDWHARWDDVAHCDAVAGLDDIRGDWRKSLRNYELYGGFPTYHETDPPELLGDLLPIAAERGGWLGVGLLPPRAGKWRWVRETMRRIPPGLHVHFWAGGEYLGHPRVDSCDSTNWLLDAFNYKTRMPFLTLAECVEIVVKRYRRAVRKPAAAEVTETGDLFAGVV
jgi:hypothetical protein